MESETLVPPGVGEIWVQGDRALACGKGAFVSLEAVQRIGEVAVGGGDARLDPDRRFNEFSALLELTSLDAQHAKHVEGVELVRFEGKRAQIVLNRFVQATASVKRQALLEGRLGSADAGSLPVQRIPRRHPPTLPSRFGQHFRSHANPQGLV
jgi:hypothetical protein